MYVKNFINYILSNVLFPTSSTAGITFPRDSPSIVRKTHVEEATIPGIQVCLA